MADLMCYAAALGATAPPSSTSGAGTSGSGRGDALRAARKAPLRSVRNEYPMGVAVDFTQLRANALRRYMAHHRIQEIPGSSQAQLAVIVARHFNEECQRADEEESISSFVSYLKEHQQVASASDSSHAPRSTLQTYDYHSDSANDDEDDDGDKENAHPGRRPQVVYDDDSEGEAHGYDDDEYYDEDDGMGDDDDDYQQDGDYDVLPHFTPRKRKPSSSGSSDKSSGKPQGKSNPQSGSSKNKKKRKTRVYCVCKGSSFGNMIACDNKKCLDRSNWYHMSCVGLNPAKDPPETWYCPTCQEQDPSEIPENQYRKPVASVTYGDMISHALAVLPQGKGTFKEICDFVEKQYESQLNWKLESDQRKSPVWKSSVRKILFSNMRFRKHPDDKGLFCLAA
uniref:PHD-type domain-containing protein n=1 Tax=Globisporangium ultimum (strain ATCC 200006 / CBS 805.95 / DAOM BR144) TaxID=431595 RepID=K3XC02_GLOUD